MSNNTTEAVSAVLVGLGVVGFVEMFFVDHASELSIKLLQSKTYRRFRRFRGAMFLFASAGFLISFASHWPTK
jgi:hypothetical protein